MCCEEAAHPLFAHVGAAKTRQISAVDGRIGQFNAQLGSADSFARLVSADDALQVGDHQIAIAGLKLDKYSPSLNLKKKLNRNNLK